MPKWRRGPPPPSSSDTQTPPEDTALADTTLPPTDTSTDVPDSDVLETHDAADSLLNDSQPEDTTPDVASDAALPVCGDGVLNQGEACDDGPGNSDLTPDACRSDCALATCGDGVTDTGEGCDDGNDDDADACTNVCEKGFGLPKPGPGDVLFTELVSFWGLPNTPFYLVRPR